MIFVAVGTQFPFDRLVKVVDQWAGEHQKEGFAQIAEGEYQPQHMPWQDFINSNDYNRKLGQASVIVSHAGMGNIITACEKQIPIIVMNRQHKLGEHRNDHQADGLSWMGKLTGVYTASTDQELIAWLDQHKNLLKPQFSENNRRDKLIAFIDSKI